MEDFDLSVDEFVAKVNTDLVNKVVNLASRTAKFVEATGLSPKYPDDGGLFAAAAKAGDEIRDAYEATDYSKAMRIIMGLADRANPYVEERKPWDLRKDPCKARELQDVCTVALNLFRQIVVYLSPVLPRLAQQTGELLNDPITRWDQSQTPLVGTPVTKFTHMLRRVEEKDVHAMIEESKPARRRVAAATASAAATVTNGTTPATPSPPSRSPPNARSTTSRKVDLRVARVIAAEDVPDAKKLLKLTLSLGGGTTKNRLRRHQGSVQAGRLGRPARRLRGQSRPAQDEVRRQRRHGHAPPAPAAAKCFVHHRRRRRRAGAARALVSMRCGTSDIAVDAWQPAFVIVAHCASLATNADAYSEVKPLSSPGRG